jgi:hypothetical protein
LAKTKKYVSYDIELKPNCQVSRILMSPRPIFSDRSENDPKFLFLPKILKKQKKNGQKY